MASLRYKVEDQSWYSAIPAIEAKEAEALNNTIIDVVLLTAVKVERDAVLRLLKPLPGEHAIVRLRINQATYYLGLFGKYRAVMMMCEMGALGRSGATLAAYVALTKWNPRALIMIGIAFGKDQDKQNIADVLVSSQIIPYGDRRVGEKLIYRGPRPEPGPTLLDRFRNTIGWTFKRPDGTQCTPREGPILSGGDLVDNLRHKKHLFNQFPHAIGGEMEGACVYAAAAHFGVEWIIIKAICDWADGNKDKLDQPLAAAAAASLVHFVLSYTEALPPRRVVIDDSAHPISNINRLQEGEYRNQQTATTETAKQQPQIDGLESLYTGLYKV